MSAAAVTKLPDAPAADHYRVLVLGAGMSGVCMGVQLRKAGVGDFLILEKADAVGGTWRENTYPGIACDVPSHVYSFSFELNPDWQHAYSGGGEIWQYLEAVVDKYGLREHLHLDCNVTAVTFDDGIWRVRSADGRELTADMVVSGLGGLHLPNHAAIEGLEDFAGPRFHTAQWRHDVDLRGKRVAIIGTGASAAQVLPNIAEDVASVTVFQRSAAWVFPRMAQDISESRRALFRKYPWLMRLNRWRIWLLMDVLGTATLRRGSWANERMAQMAHEHLEASVTDPETRRQLTPNYTAGCKRRVISDDYLSSFNRDNVHLVTDGIERIEAGGVRDANGELHEVDVIIEATGFRPFDITDYVSITGRDGRTLADTWKERVESFRTLMVPGFPNLFFLLGPNSATGHTSALIMIETAAKYVMRCMRLLRRRNLQWLEPKADVTKRFNDRLQGGMQQMVFGSGCNAWYTDDNDFNFTLWPFSAARFVLEFQRVRPDDFDTRAESGA